MLRGFGFAACAFGVGAARVNGHFEHAFPMTAEMLAACIPLPSGMLLGPRLLSNASDAPYLGEAAILYILTRLPVDGTEVRLGGAIPGWTFLLLSIQAGLGVMLVAVSVMTIRKTLVLRQPLITGAAGLQFAAWLALGVAGAFLLIDGRPLLALAALLFAQLLPRARRPGGSGFQR